MLPGPDWVTAPAWWQRALLGVLSAPFVAAGAAFLVPAALAAAVGQLCALCLYYGLPIGSLGALLSAAALLPKGDFRLWALTIGFVSLAWSLAIFGLMTLKISA